MQLTAFIPALDEAENLVALLPSLARSLEELAPGSWEMLVVDGGSRDATGEVAARCGARVVPQEGRGYAGAYRTGLAEARGDWIVTLDADLSHEPGFLARLWARRGEADIVVASRYCRGGVADMPWGRLVLSRVLNRFFALGLSVPVRDLSSGFRLYRAAAVRDIPLESTNFEVLEELLVRALMAGGRVVEAPFTYFPRGHGRSHARVFRFGLDLLRTFGRLWALRYSAAAADFEERAFHSPLLPQRWRNRRRHRAIVRLARGAGRTLDVGCGSSLVLSSLSGAVGVDASLAKVRFMRRHAVPVVNGSALRLPFRAVAFDCVVASQLLEYLPRDAGVFLELHRVLRPGGLLILTTPDHGRWTWRALERAFRWTLPRRWATPLLSRYTGEELARAVEAMGCTLTLRQRTWWADAVVAARRGAGAADADADVVARALEDGR